MTKLRRSRSVVTTTEFRGIMKNTATRSLIVLGAFIVFSVTNALAQSSGLSGDRWKLTEAYGKPVTHSSAYVEFAADLSKFTGNTGCNRMFGSVTLRGRSIDLYNIGSTKMFCKLMAGNVPESTFLKALNDAAKYWHKGNTLSLTDKRGRTILEFTRLRQTDPGDDRSSGSTRLEDKKWVLESIGNRRTLVAIKGAFVVFDPNKGSAGGDSGCNVFGGNYTATRNGLAIKNIISTMRACIEDDKMQIEREFLDGLKNATRFEISDGRLRLYSKTDLLLTFRGEPK